MTTKVTAQEYREEILGFFMSRNYYMLEDYDYQISDTLADKFGDREYDDRIQHDQVAYEVQDAITKKLEEMRMSWAKDQEATNIKIGDECCEKPHLSMTRQAGDSVIYTCSNCLQQIEQNV
jgi:hypothetical protein